MTYPGGGLGRAARRKDQDQGAGGGHDGRLRERPDPGHSGLLVDPEEQAGEEDLDHGDVGDDRAVAADVGGEGEAKGRRG